MRSSEIQEHLGRNKYLRRVFQQCIVKPRSNDIHAKSKVNNLVEQRMMRGYADPVLNKITTHDAIKTMMKRPLGNVTRNEPNTLRDQAIKRGTKIRDVTDHLKARDPQQSCDQHGYEGNRLLC